MSEQKRDEESGLLAFFTSTTPITSFFSPLILVFLKLGLVETSGGANWALK